MKKKIGIALIIIAVSLITAGIVLFFTDNKETTVKTVKVESIKVPQEGVVLEYGEKLEVEYTVQPQDATNKEVKITSMNGILSNSDNKKEFVAINAAAHGEEKICITSVEDENIKACYDVYVKPEPFSQRMERFGYKQSGYKYTRGGEVTDELDVSQKYIKSTMRSGDVYLEYTYYFRRGYGESYQKTGQFTINWIYRDGTQRASCSASAYYDTFCNYSSESSVINNFNVLKENLEILISDYTDQELLT